MHITKEPLPEQGHYIGCKGSRHMVLTATNGDSKGPQFSLTH